MAPSRVVASMATIPARVEVLPAVVASLLPQVDRLNVVLNGHRALPECLTHPKVHAQYAPPGGGDAGKFAWLHVSCETHLTVDDDILYPPDYVIRLRHALNAHKGAVGVHGVCLHSRSELAARGYYKARTVTHFAAANQVATPAHILGTGTLAFRPEHVRALRVSDFKHANMADIWFGIAMQRARVPLTCVSRDARWLVPLPAPGPTIFDRARHADALQTGAILSVPEWSFL